MKRKPNQIAEYEFSLMQKLFVLYRYVLTDPVLANVTVGFNPWHWANRPKCAQVSTFFTLIRSVLILAFAMTRVSSSFSTKSYLGPACSIATKR